MTKKRKQADGWGNRLTKQVIPASAVEGLERARRSVMTNLERAKMYGHKEVACANGNVLRRIKTTLAICQKYNDQG